MPTLHTATSYFNPRSPHGERPDLVMAKRGLDDFNPRSPHGERRRWQFCVLHRLRISIHAPRTGSDRMAGYKILWANISIHAPRTGSDCNHRDNVSVNQHFNPRSPHGERREFDAYVVYGDIIFQSTLPARGATSAESVTRRRSRNFNPRSPHGERLGGASWIFPDDYFNPRSP